MADMMALSTVYNHYLTTFAKGNVSRYDTHKKSELRSVYNSIVKLNKESPLYILDQSSETKAYAVGLKEGARELHNVIASLSSQEDDGTLMKKVAYSSNENIATAEYIGEELDKDKIPSYDIEVISLATPQEHLGFYLPKDEMELALATYSFDIHTHNLNYEFQYSIGPGDTNLSTQERLARLISGAGIGIEAEVRSSNDGEASALFLRSLSTGSSEKTGASFTVTDDKTSKQRGSVQYFGIGETTGEASDAEVMINGERRFLSSNRFTLDNAFEVELHTTDSPNGKSTTVHVKNDTESVRENLHALANGYNNFIDSVLGDGSVNTKGATLMREMRGLVSAYENDLSLSGIRFEEDGKIAINDQTISEFDDEKFKTAFGGMRSFANALLRKTNQISINPMEYVDKTIVAYKNPGKNYASPYITSSYSGMMFNSYC